MNLRALALPLAAVLAAAPVASHGTQSGNGRADGLYLGADLSFANEMEDCGAIYRSHGKRTDPFTVLKQAGGNLVRVRLWNNPTWTNYSNLADVEKTIRRARSAGLQVLLDFHYSDDWADGEKQLVPAAWAGMDTDQQAKALYQFTFDTLRKLDGEGLMPEMVQVGNETNPELMGGRKEQPIDWKRNAALLNAGVKAVRDAGRLSAIRPKVMLHIAQPENVEPWFDDATVAGVLDYDIIGISYYRKWSVESLAQLGATIARVGARYQAQVMVVETAYPFTFEGADSSPNLLGDPSVLLPQYPATPEGQRDYMIALTQTVVDNGGIGVNYWAPDWLSTKCKTRWGTGTNWENAAWFSLRRHEVLPVVQFLERDYRPATKAIIPSPAPR
ncbi:arabinogalactan endo-1,4-beta-galactosidase [Novosphingobium sp. CF614]|uniref:glycoside hydrolase family 53 protein n=1 Tax=Novosphingobium sp. CF614 TaxID=1884364 RepID=UPI0008E78B84|nr:arabinogalactan endo-1,4-beta-galactosidase [Novosphingobium sp. CF614]SFF85465.1 arabinogalactan endo-1,4-beta-galactosidase [Novosphingobium sp. CF614]